MHIVPVLPTETDPAVAEEVPTHRTASRRTFGRQGKPSRRTFGRRPAPSRRTFGIRGPSRRTFGLRGPSRRTFGKRPPG